MPRAIIMGNHDDEADLMREQIVHLDIRLKVPHGLSKTMSNIQRMLLQTLGCKAHSGAAHMLRPFCSLWLCFGLHIRH